ncbi:MAG: hypothetical protein WDN06_21720 [Asticcacaulis sp.]
MHGVLATAAGSRLPGRVLPDGISPRTHLSRGAAPAAAPFSSSAQPLAREPLGREPRRSIFEGRPRFEEREDEAYASASGDLGRVARALEALGTRIESSEGRSANAVRGVSHAVESLLDRLERSESATAETQSRLDEQNREVVESVERLGRAEEDREALGPAPRPGPSA